LGFTAYLAVLALTVEVRAFLFILPNALLFYSPSQSHQAVTLPLSYRLPCRFGYNNFLRK